MASSPAWTLINPTVSKVSRSGSKSSVPARWIDRIGDSTRASKVTACPERTWTRPPGAGTRRPSQVAGSDHRPLATDLTKGTSAPIEGVAIPAIVIQKKRAFRSNIMMGSCVAWIRRARTDRSRSRRGEERRLDEIAERWTFFLARNNPPGWSSAGEPNFRSVRPPSEDWSVPGGLRFDACGHGRDVRRAQVEPIAERSTRTWCPSIDPTRPKFFEPDP